MELPKSRSQSTISPTLSPTDTRKLFYLRGAPTTGRRCRGRELLARPTFPKQRRQNYYKVPPRKLYKRNRRSFYPCYIHTAISVSLKLVHVVSSYRYVRKSVRQSVNAIVIPYVSLYVSLKISQSICQSVHMSVISW